MSAPNASVRARLARRGLATRAALDKTTHAMLLRQLYLALFESRRFDEARAVAESATELRVISDVLHHDAARAAVADGDLAGGVMHLRTAARRAPASRRALHWWTLGSALFHARRYRESIAALERAVRWSSHERPLYRAHLALVRIASGEQPEGVQAMINELAAAPAGQGYGLFVLGHLAYAAGEFAPAQRFLEAFLKRTETWSPAMVVALEPEVEMTRTTLTKMVA